MVGEKHEAIRGFQEQTGTCDSPKVGHGANVVNGLRVLPYGACHTPGCITLCNTPVIALFSTLISGQVGNAALSNEHVYL